MLAPAFRYNSGIIRFNATPFLDATGGETSAGLVDRHGNPISSSLLKSVSAIHRTDWQGRQLLYSTSRKNSIYPSDGISSWSKTSGITESSATAFSGTSMAPQLVTNAGTIVSASIAPTGSNGSSGQSCAWIVLEIASSNKSPSCILRIYDNTSSAYVIGSTLNLTTGATSLYAGSGTYGAFVLSNSGPNSGTVYLFYVSGNVTSGHTSSVTFFPTAAGTVAGSVIVHCAQVESSSLPRGYIRTTSAAVTSTDYTLSGATVNFGEAANAGAVYDWDGIAVR